MQAGRRLKVEPGWSVEEEVDPEKQAGWRFWHRRGAAAVREKLVG